MATKNQNKKDLVINQVIVQAPPRRVYDVGEWRSALRSADLGTVRYLYNLYDDILIDGILADAIDKRVQAVINSHVTFIDKNEEEVSEICDIINSSAGETMLRCIMSQRFFGRAGFEISFANGFLCEEIKPKYINLQQKTILLNDLGDKSISYDGNTQILVLGKPFDYGLLLKTAPLAIYKRGGFGDYAQWIELFGMPQRIGKYNTYDPDSRKLLEQAFKTAGSAPYLIVPKESEIETHVVSKGSGTSYDEFRKACNEEMLISILGQTLTTTQGERGARSLGEVHKDVENSKHDGDLRFVEHILNEYVRPMLEARGFDLKGGRFRFPENSDPMTVSDLATLSKLIEIPATFVHKKYGIPMPKDGEKIARAQTKEVIEVNNDKQPTNNPPKKTKEVQVHDEQGFFRRTWNFFVGAPQVGAKDGIVLTMKDAKTLDERVIARTPHSKGFNTELFEYFSNDLISAFRKGWESTIMADTTTISLEYSIQDDALKTAMEMNLYRFSAAKTLAEIQELNQIFRESSSYSEFEKRAKLVCAKFNKQWQRTEYDTALLSAQSASNYQRLFNKRKLYPYWQYRTIHDGRVRPSHRLLDSVVLPAEDPLWDKIFPPNGWNCRCRVKPLLAGEYDREKKAEMHQKVKEFLKADDWSNAEVDGWAINRAKLGLVFTENQNYVNMRSNASKWVLNGLTHVDYNLPTIEECIEKATENMPIYDGTTKEWYKKHSVLIDYLGRKIEMSEDSFIEHTTKKKYIEQGRPRMLDAVIEILKNPDEIWIHDHSRKKYDINFIKYYKGKIMNVICLVDDLKYSISTWFEITVNKKTRHKYRRGLLVKNK